MAEISKLLRNPQNSFGTFEPVDVVVVKDEDRVVGRYWDLVHGATHPQVGHVVHEMALSIGGVDPPFQRIAEAVPCVPIE